MAGERAVSCPSATSARGIPARERCIFQEAGSEFCLGVREKGRRAILARLDLIRERQVGARRALVSDTGNVF